MLACLCLHYLSIYVQRDTLTQGHWLGLHHPLQLYSAKQEHRLHLAQVLGNDGLATLSFREFLLVYPWLASTVEALGASLPQTR